MSKKEMIQEIDSLEKQEQNLIKKIEVLEVEYKNKIRKKMDDLVAIRERVSYLEREIKKI